MTITKIISTAAYGPESASLDVAIKLKILDGGFAPKAPVVNGAQAVGRFKLTERPFGSALDCVKANMDISDGTLIFTRGEPDQDIRYLIDYAKGIDHPIRLIDFLQSLSGSFLKPFLEGYMRRFTLSIIC